MRFSFEAIDGSDGRVRRGVLRADDEEQAREILLGEDIYPKQLESVDEGVKVTWAPKKPFQERLRANAGKADDPAKLFRAIFETRALFGLEGQPPGKAGLNESEGLVFRPGSGDPLVAPREQVETAVISGFPARRLVVTLLDGRTFEFAAGFLMANGNASEIARTLRAK